MSKQFSLPEVESIDEVPEEFKAFYFASEGKVQRQKPDMLVSTLNKIKRDNERVSAEALELRNAVALYKEVLGDDADPERIKVLKEKAAKADSLQTDEDVEKRIATVKATGERDLEKARTILKDREATIETYAVTAAIRDALKQVDANEDALDLLPSMIRSRLRVEYKDREVVINVLDKDGSKKVRDDGADASLLDLANEYKMERPKLFNGTRQSGAGAQGEAFQLTPGQTPWNKMNDKEKIQYRNKHGESKTVAFMSATG